MKCSGCPYHHYEVGMEDADEYCAVFGDFPEDEKSRKDEEGCIYNLRTLHKYKRQNDASFEQYLKDCDKAGVAP